MSRQLIMDFTHYTSSQCQPSHGFIPVLTRTINHSALTRTRNHGFHLVHDSTPKPNVATTVTPPSVSDRKLRSLSAPRPPAGEVSRYGRLHPSPQDSSQSNPNTLICLCTLKFSGCTLRHRSIFRVSSYKVAGWVCCQWRRG